MSETLEWLSRPDVWSGPDGIPARVLEHGGYSGLAVFIAALIALPVGLLIGHTGRGSLPAATVSNVWRALPTLGLVVLVFRLEPLSLWPVIAVLVVIAVPPILLNTDVGIRSVDAGVRDAARGMGMSGWQALWRVEVPIAMPLIVAGLRSAAGQVVATATIAAFVGLGGLGRYIIDGYAARDIGQITGGAIVVGLLALVVEGAFALLQRGLGRTTTARPPITGPVVHVEEVRA
ncbi:MAG: ABC transporter permease [Actinomycetota bacterium]|nr:ABC transporter permease [Actinomycetota bacterium]